MRLERLQIKGLTRFTDPVDVDFTRLPAGLIAIVGENGAGKSTLLDSCLAGLYRKFPSRADRPLFDYATAKDGYIDEVFSIDGLGRFRVRVSLDGVARKSDAVLEQITEAGPVALNDGKVSTFQAAIDARFPPESLVLASIFSSQNRNGSFLTLDKKGRKDLFAALLGLDHYERMAATARDAGRRLERRLIELRTLDARLDAETSAELRESIHQRGNALAADLVTASHQADALRGASAALAERVETCRAAVEASRDQVRRRDQFRTEVAERQGTLAAVQADAEAVRQDEQARLARLTSRLAEDEARIGAAIEGLPTEAVLTQRADGERAALRARCDEDVRVIDQKIANNRAELIDKADAITAAVATVERLEALLADQTTAVETARETLSARGREVEAALAKEASLADAPAARDRAAATAALMQDVPCHGQGAYAGCALLRDAKDAETRLPELDAKVAAFQQAQAAVKAAVAARAEASQAEHDALAAHTATRMELREVRPLAERKALLDAATTRIAELEAQRQERLTRAEAEIAEVQTRADAAAETVAAERRRLLGERAALRQRHAQDDAAVRAEVERRIGELNGKATDLQAQIADRETALSTLSSASQIADAATEALREAEAAREAHAEQVAAATARVATLQAERQTFEADRRRLLRAIDEQTQVQAAIRTLEQERVEFDALAQALGSDGLPVLEIDAAGPAVSDLCNDLLRSCFGSSRFTVELITQQAKASGKGLKEVFDLRVFDAERGNEPRALTDLSGGEQVIVDESLKSAIALFVAQQHGLRWRTVFRDETTGALDPENAVRYVHLLRRLLERGGYERAVFVTHNAEAAAMADAQLVVADGTVTMRFAPFERQEAA